MKLFKVIVLVCGCVFAGLPVVQAEESHKIPLKLFGENVVGDYDGCHFALWQQDRNPDEDKYSYVFYAPIPDAEQLPGWVKIGDRVYEMQRLDVSADTGLLDKHQLFRDHDGTVTLIMDILEQERPDNDLIIDKARITIVMKGKFPFVITVKGRLGCPPPGDGLPGEAISLGAAVNHDSFGDVPAPILAHVRKAYSQECNLDQGPEYATSYAISDAMTLWELPCGLYARNATSVFFTALNNNEDYFAPLAVTGPPGVEVSDHFDILNANVIPGTAEITSVSVGPGQDCGTYEQHQLRAVEGEAIELLLVEYREKIDCDGIQTEPADYPLVYSAR